MAIDLSKYLGGTPGTWNIGPFQLPDYGFTETRSGGGPTWQNPLIPYAQAAESTPPPRPPGGGGGSWGGDNVLGVETGPTGSTGESPTGGFPTGGSPMQPSGPSEQDFLSSQLNSIFNPVFAALQGQENILSANYATVPGEIEAQYQTSAGNLAQQQKQGMAELTSQETQIGKRQTDALTAAIRLFNELQRGGQQRFGRASSAGEAYGALTAIEQQRRQGTIQSAYETAMQQVGQYKTNLNEKYALALQDLENQKNSALNEAQRDFRDALQQIQNAKAQAQSDKATASLNALQDLRNRVYTINQQSLSFAQQLALNNQISLKAVDDYTQKVAQSISGAQVVGTNFANQATLNPTTSYGISPGQTAPQTAIAQTGAINKTWHQDENGNWVYS
jgi:hypothetical protein